MQIDNTTYLDLSVFQTADDFSLFGKLDRTRTIGGRIQLLDFFNHPFSDIQKIRETQEMVKDVEEYYDCNVQALRRGM